MRKVFIIFCITGIAHISAALAVDFDVDRQKARKAYERLKLTAHPLPAVTKTEAGASVQAADQRLPLFLNVNTIDEETGQDIRVQNESSIAVNPKNPKVIIASAVDYRSVSSTWVYVSSDGGKSWVNLNLGKPFPDWRSSNDPSVAFDGEGNGYLVYGGFGQISDTSVLFGENGVFLARTSDDGKTWKAHIPIILHKGEQTLDSTFEDKYYISVDLSPTSAHYGTLYVPWKRVTPADSATQIVISKSTDRGETWSLPKAVSRRLAGSSEDTTYGQSFPLAVVGSYGEVYVIWNHGIEHGVGFAKSTDGCVTFSEPRIIHKYNIFGKTKYLEGQGWRHSVKEKVRAEAYPAMVCDVGNGPRRGWLYLTWSADEPPNIYFSRSTDGGNTWSAPKFVHSVTKNDQFWHWIAIDPTDGDLAVMYLDSRDHDDNIYVDTYVSYSSDGGTSWVDRRASDASGDIRKNPFTANSFAGDYSGCAFYDGIVYPSWIDMRSAETNILDSDIYTSIINTDAPSAVDNFKAEIVPETPTQVRLVWDRVTTLSFGQTVTKKLTYELYRNGSFIKSFDQDVTSYNDNGLTAHQRYDYTIYAAVQGDTSTGSTAGVWAGGSRLPMACRILSAAGSAANEVKLSIQMPTHREDSLTPLVNLGKILLYRDSVRVGSFDIAKNDTGKTVMVTETVPVRGFYIYFAKVADDALPANESNPSNQFTTYTGKVENRYEDDFDAPSPPKYDIRGNWSFINSFNHSSPRSLCNAPNGSYSANQFDTLTVFPITGNGYATALIRFYHVALVEARDSCIVEYTRDGGNRWDEIASYDKSSYPQWNTNNLTSDSWVESWNLLYVGDPGDTAFVRFRFKSNLIKNNKGWFIDDIKIYEQEISVGEENNKSGVRLFPNPASEYLTVQAMGIYEIEPASLIIYNALGESLAAAGLVIQSHDGSVVLDLSLLPGGIYFLGLTKHMGIADYKPFIIYK